MHIDHEKLEQVLISGTMSVSFLCFLKRTNRKLHNNTHTDIEASMRIQFFALFLSCNLKQRIFINPFCISSKNKQTITEQIIHFWQKSIWLAPLLSVYTHCERSVNMTGMQKLSLNNSYFCNELQQDQMLFCLPHRWMTKIVFLIIGQTGSNGPRLAAFDLFLLIMAFPPNATSISCRILFHVTFYGVVTSHCPLTF